ncbi:hypothetical protein QEH59_12470 [Coraliomargarita sp. SDUM461004]|uniref:Uncharacterized protein n=1 Tax=Thalassobacterium sedimentorum TaxID=3041258 RepID=A0ABU1AKA4_9BACT|nr:hypothetical protein [Coraliomargarita sp. SDUM461004]MDQ8195245.1 hypothetical protein [Coraliomargarita sp. SDUM461004]
MSGGGSGNGGTRWGGGDFDSPCHSLNVTTQIHSPDEDVVNLLQVGDLLDVTLHVEDGEEAIVVLHKSDTVGAVIHERLRDCISAGNAYQAEVIEIEGGVVRVRISISEGA